MDEVRPLHGPSTGAPDDLTAAQIRAAVDHAIGSRRSVRGFLPTPFDRTTIESILSVASRSPSGNNTQPWHVHVLTGASLATLAAEIHAVYDDAEASAEHVEEYAYYPVAWPSPYAERRRKTGWDLYTLLGIRKGESDRMREQHRRNYQFCDAPVGLFFSIDRIMERGSWLDYGMFIENIMIAARGHGLDTCPQAAFNQYHRIISRQLGLPESRIVVCGMALGHADNSRIENTLETEREPVARFTTFLD
ncbi:nitroreductase [soil metagenome]